MVGETRGHETNISIAGPSEIAAGGEMTLAVNVSCASTCDLRGNKVAVIANDSTVLMEVEIVEFDGTANKTGGFTLAAPTEPGKYTWTAALSVREPEDGLHEESRTPFSFVVKPHATSMAVWDVPSPVVQGDKFKVKVGAQCSARCNLAGTVVEIRNYQETVVATGTLGGTPWSSSGALYWAEVDIEAPATEGTHSWSAKLQRPDPEIPHEGSSYPFAFATTRPSDHMVTIKVVAKDTKVPLSNAFITLQASEGFPYRGCTDDAGQASVSVPKGEYNIYVLRDDYSEFETRATVLDDVAIRAELQLAPNLGI